MIPQWNNYVDVRVVWQMRAFFVSYVEQDGPLIILNICYKWAHVFITVSFNVQHASSSLPLRSRCVAVLCLYTHIMLLAVVSMYTGTHRMLHITTGASYIFHRGHFDWEAHNFTTAEFHLALVLNAGSPPWFVWTFNSRACPTLTVHNVCVKMPVLIVCMSSDE